MAVQIIFYNLNVTDNVICIFHIYIYEKKI